MIQNCWTKNLLLTSWPWGDWNSCATAAKASLLGSWSTTGTSEALVTGGCISGWELVATVQIQEKDSTPAQFFCMQFITDWTNHNLPFLYSQIPVRCIVIDFKHSSEWITFITFQCRGNGSICHIHQRLNDVHVEHTILLPQVQNTYNFALIKVKKKLAHLLDISYCHSL